MSRSNIFFYFFLLFIATTTLFAKTEVKLLSNSYLDTKVGTIKNQKLITFIQQSVTESVKKEIKQKESTKVKKLKKTTQKRLSSVAKKKQNYVKKLAPIVQKVYKQLQKKYNQTLQWIQNNSHKKELQLLRKEYKVKTNIELIKAIKPHPVSIVLAQGAMESAWLTSRFATEANNIFGVWSFSKNEPRIAAGGSREGKIIYLKKYKSLEHSVKDYYKSIGKSWAYDKLREKRIYITDPHALLPTFEKYSEKGLTYTKILGKIIKNNNFEQYDIRK